MNDTKERTIIGWCDNDSCGEPIYKDDIHYTSDEAMYCDTCFAEPEPEEL